MTRSRGVRESESPATRKRGRSRPFTVIAVGGTSGGDTSHPEERMGGPPLAASAGAAMRSAIARTARNRRPRLGRPLLARGLSSSFETVVPVTRIRNSIRRSARSSEPASIRLARLSSVGSAMTIVVCAKSDDYPTRARNAALWQSRVSDNRAKRACIRST